jgi:hypothetical protein
MNEAHLALPPEAQFVLAHFQRVLGGDGSTLSVDACNGATLRIRYVKGDCSDCVMENDDLAEMMIEMLQARSSRIQQIEIVA